MRTFSLFSFLFFSFCATSFLHHFLPCNGALWIIQSVFHLFLFFYAAFHVVCLIFLPKFGRSQTGLAPKYNKEATALSVVRAQCAKSLKV